MLSPLPRRSGWARYFAPPPSRISLPRKGCRVGLRIVLFEACTAFTRVTACTLALSPIRDTLTRGFSHFVTSMTAPVASGWSGCRVGLAPTGKRRLSTAHTHCGRGTKKHDAIAQAVLDWLNGTLWMFECASVGLDARELYHLAPLLGVVGNEL